jgi:hypothetical protein
MKGGLLFRKGLGETLIFAKCFVIIRSTTPLQAAILDFFASKFPAF